jgi:hypothetical protein
VLLPLCSLEVLSAAVWDAADWQTMTLLSQIALEYSGHECMNHESATLGMLARTCFSRVRRDEEMRRDEGDEEVCRIKER